MIKTAIVGATGYTGSELIRILLHHPEFEITAITSESKAGKRFSDIHPAFNGLCDQTLIKSDELNQHQVDLLFLALPHGISMEFVRKFAKWKAKIVDLSGDFRLDSPSTYKQWYQKKHSYEIGFNSAVYGLPELNRDAIKGAELVANPGCYPTASILSLLPLAEANLLPKKGLFIDAKSGTTGAGVKASDGTHFSNVNENFKAYKIASHRHTIEIELILNRLQFDASPVQFTPHLLPVDRGILATSYVSGLNTNQAELKELFHNFYVSHPFVQVVDRAPSLKEVRGTNLCKVYPHYDERTQNVIVVSVIDNLVKGAAGQAVQNANIMFGIAEDCGLIIVPLSP